MEAEITYAENVICATSETPKDQYCTCRAFWTGDDCNEGFLFYYPTAGMFYAVFFTIVFFGLFVFAAYEIYLITHELSPEHVKHNNATGRAGKHNNADNLDIIKKRGDSVTSNKPTSARSTMVAGFFQPTRVRMYVQSCCCFGSFMRFMYLLTHATDSCREGSPCSALFFEPANVMFISSALLTVMFWKKMGMMFKKGISRANQGEEDIKFFQIFGFYFWFQTTMIVVQVVAAANKIQVTALYDISLMISGIYIMALLYGSLKFGIMLVRMITSATDSADGSNADGEGGVPAAKKIGRGSTDTKAKTWQKIRKVVIMLMYVVPSSALYIICLGVYIIFGMRYDVSFWMPMQYIFRTLESIVVFGFISCLSSKKVPTKHVGLDASRGTSVGSRMSARSTAEGGALRLTGSGEAAHGGGLKQVAEVDENDDDFDLDEQAESIRVQARMSATMV
jgi:hypothetical protein